MTSLTLQNKIVTLSDLPNSNTPNIGMIPSHYLFPILGKVNTEPEYMLHSDGSVFQTFKLPDISLQIIGKMLENMPDDSSFQFYRIQESDRVDYYLCQRIEIDYSFINIEGKNIFNSIFSSYMIYERKMEKITRERIEEGKRALPGEIKIVDTRSNKVYEYLCDYQIDKDFGYTKYPVKSNISAIKTGDLKHSCVLSINNLDALPLCSGILKGKKFLEVITFTKPSKMQRDEIERTIEINKEILKAIRPIEVQNRGYSVDTMKNDINKIVDEISSGIFFVNVSFCLFDVSLQDLRKQYSDFEGTLYKKGIVLYSHSNSARAQYVSFFPGNAVYGEHWNKCYKIFGLMMFSKVMEL